MSRSLLHRCAAALLGVVCAAASVADQPATLDDTLVAQPVTHRYALIRGVYPDGSEWETRALDFQFGFADDVLAQCGIDIGRYELLALDSQILPDALSPDATERALIADLLGDEPRPLAFFVDTLPDVTGDYVAYPRDEAPHEALANTVWIARSAEDLGVSLLARGLTALACNCTHIGARGTPDMWTTLVLPANLMAPLDGDAAISNRLTQPQCVDLKDPARHGGLLESLIGP